MALDLGDVGILAGLNASNQLDNYSNMQDLRRDLRAQNIQDNFGVKPQNFAEFSQTHKGFGLLKTLFLAAGLAAVAAASFAFIAPIATFVAGYGIASAGTAALAGGLVGALIGGIKTALHQSAVASAYDDYLGDMAAQARQAKEQSLGHARAPIQFDNPAPTIPFQQAEAQRRAAAQVSTGRVKQ